VKPIYNSDVDPGHVSDFTVDSCLRSALRDAEYLAGLMCTALCKSEPYSLNDPVMCKIAPDTYAESMDEATHLLEDEIMIAFYKAVDRVRVKLGKPTLDEEQQAASV